MFELVALGSLLINNKSEENTGDSLYIVFLILVYVVLTIVAVRTSVICNRGNLGWTISSGLTAFLFPVLYLLVHPNLSLSANGTYCLH
jgi:hypothetical protein